MNLSKNNKVWYLISCLFLGLLFLEIPTQSVNASTSKKPEESDTVITVVQYKKNILKSNKVGVSGLYKLITKKGNHPFYLFFGSEECQYCRKFSVTLKKFMAQKSTQPVYYVDVNKFGVDADSHSVTSKKVISFINDRVNLHSIPTIVAVNNTHIIKIYHDSNTTLKQLTELNKRLISK